MVKANETKEEVKIVTEEKKDETNPVNKNNGIICIVIGVVLVVASTSRKSVFPSIVNL